MGESLEKFRKQMKAFQAEQEAALLKISATKSKVSAPLKTRSRDDNPLSKCLDVDCFLLPGSSAVSVAIGKKPASSHWPVALVAQLSEKFADVGTLESHGSLWRCLKLDNAINAAMYVLQSSEIGETPLFLTSELDLVDTIDRAAKWDIRVVSPAPKRDSSESSELSGVFLQFLLIDTDEIGGTGYGGDDLAKRLVCALSAQDGSPQGVALLSPAQIDASYQRGEDIDWRITWELITEESSAAVANIQGAEFLEEGIFVE